MRKFTQEAYDALQEGVADDCGEWTGVIDFFSDVPMQVTNFFDTVELQDDLSNFKSYLEEVADLNDYTAKEIDEIFGDVINVDEHYAGLIGNINEQMQNYDNVVKKLRDCISDSGFEANFSKETFLKELPEETQMLLGANWKNILSKDVEDITEEEFNMIAEYLIKTGNEELLEEMLRYCYTIVEPENGVKNPTVFQNGLLSTTEKYRYRINEKFLGLAAAVNRVTTVWTTIDYGLKEDEEREKWITTAMQYNAFLTGFSKNTDLVMVTETASDGTIRYMNKKLFDIEWNLDGSISVTYYPYFSTPTTLEEEKRNMETMTTSAADYDQAGQDALIQQGFKYINVYSGVGQSAVGAMTEETVNQISSALIGKIPILGEAVGVASSIGSVLEAGSSAVETNNVILKSEQIANMGWMVDEFGLLCVGNDVDGDVSKYGVFLYPGKNTQQTVDAFNTYMELNPDTAAKVGYPLEGLTVEYILDVQNAEEVHGILQKIADAGIDFSVIKGEE